MSEKPQKRGKMQKSLTIRLSPWYITMMDRMIEAGVYGSKSEVVREALRILFDTYEEKMARWRKRAEMVQPKETEE